jgi:hypothetical protein
MGTPRTSASPGGVRFRILRGGMTITILALVLVAPAPALAITPVAGGSFGMTLYPINVASGVDAFDPHVSGDIAVYTADAHLRYYDFFAGTDLQVPAPVGATDLLSDVSSGQIAFTRFSGGAARILVFETASLSTTEIDPQPNPLRLGSAIANGTVAFIDQTDDPTGDLYVGSVGGGTYQVTNDGRFTQNPNVGPNGLHVVYESCATDPSDCAIREADKTSGAWVVQSLTTDGTEAEASPDTDGSIVVYDATRASDRELAWQPVGGGAEQVLTLAGTQRNPSISAGIVAFESVAPGASSADLYVYEIATNRLFQVTVSPSIDDSLNDVFVLANGTVRVVWSEGPLNDRDVRGADLVLPPAGPTYSFGGFLQPVDALPTLNSLKAGAAVPAKFSLGGDFGLDIFAAGYPKSQAVACDSTAPVDGVEQTTSAGASGLAYDPASGLYTYVWKTDKGWAGSCRQLVLSFADGTIAHANFKLK